MTDTIQITRETGRTGANSMLGGGLARSLETALTDIVRFRDGRLSPPDGAQFRSTMAQELQRAASEAGANGHGDSAIVEAGFGVIAFLDYSVINSRSPIRDEWQRNPMQEDVFGSFRGGDVFFQVLDQLLERPRSEDRDGVLEIYLLCLLMGFRGRYGTEESPRLEEYKRKIYDQLTSGGVGDLSPAWKPGPESIAEQRDPLMKWLGLLTAAVLVILVGLWIYAVLELRSPIALG